MPMRFIIPAFIVIAILVVLLNQFVYDDWRCIFAECRIQK